MKMLLAALEGKLSASVAHHSSLFLTQVSPKWVLLVNGRLFSKK